MNRWLLCLLMITFVGMSGYSQITKAADVKKVQNESLNISSGDKEFPAYLSAPTEKDKWPAVVMLHSFNGLEPGYKTLAEGLASEGFVVVAPEWQTFNKTPSNEVVGQLIRDAVVFLKNRDDVNTDTMGLVGFCAGGRYTMLFLPQMEFKSGVAFYGFPYSGGFLNESKPADFISRLKAPLLMIHGTHDQASKISDIYRYATDLNASGKYFELKVYYGEPHGFMVENGQLSQSFPAKDAYWQMVTFFNRTLK